MRCNASQNHVLFLSCFSSCHDHCGKPSVAPTTNTFELEYFYGFAALIVFQQSCISPKALQPHLPPPFPLNLPQLALWQRVLM
jgi:hypothetical protein